VYIKEEVKGPRTITGVATSIAAFIGVSRRGPANQPKRVLSYSNFIEKFGDPQEKWDLGTSVRMFFTNGGTDCYVVNVNSGKKAGKILRKDDGYTTAAASTMEIKFEAKEVGVWGNSILVKITENSGKYNLIIKYGEIEEKIEDCILDDDTNPEFIEKKIKENSELITCTISILDNTAKIVEGDYNLEGATSKAGKKDYENGIKVLERIDLINLLIITKKEKNQDYIDILTEAIKFCKNYRAFLLADPPDEWKDDNEKVNTDKLKLIKPDDYVAVFFPTLSVKEYNPEEGVYKSRTIGPAAAIAGVISRIDSLRGVWAAPAGLDAYISGIDDLGIKLTDVEQGVLNPKGVNCIRSFPSGIVSWGARTMADKDSPWKYISVRRLALFIEETLYRSTQWVVFKSNDEPLWATIRASIGAFMQGLYDKGAFQGSPKEAFFVKCDGETTTPDDQEKGIVNIIVGFAPVKPAEFVIITVQRLIGKG
jgi:hypothetical protein